MSDLAIDGKLRDCDSVKLTIGDLVSGGRVRGRAIVVQRKTGRPAQSALLEPARTGILDGRRLEGGTREDDAVPNRPGGITPSALGSMRA